MLPAGFEPAIPASELLKTHALDCTATGIGRIITLWLICTRIVETSEGLCTSSYVITDSSTIHVCCCREVQEHSLTNASSGIAVFLQNYSHELSTQLTAFTTFMHAMCRLHSAFDVCKSVHHHTLQINQPTRCNNFTSLLLDVHMWFNMFQASPRPSSGAYNCTRSLWFYR